MVDAQAIGLGRVRAGAVFALAVATLVALIGIARAGSATMRFAALRLAPDAARPAAVATRDEPGPEVALEPREMFHGCLGCALPVGWHETAF